MVLAGEDFDTQDYGRSKSKFDNNPRKNFKSRDPKESTTSSSNFLSSDESINRIGYKSSKASLSRHRISQARIKTILNHEPVSLVTTALSPVFRSPLRNSSRSSSREHFHSPSPEYNKMKLSAVSQMLLNLKKENCQNQKLLKKQRRQLRSKTRQFGDLQQRLEFLERELQYEQDTHQEQVAQLND